MTCSYETERIAEDRDRLAHNPEVAGSNPVPATMTFRLGIPWDPSLNAFSGSRVWTPVDGKWARHVARDVRYFAVTRNHRSPPFPSARPNLSAGLPTLCLWNTRRSTLCGSGTPHGDCFVPAIPR